MERPSCRTCVHWNDTGERESECMRMPPTVFVIPFPRDDGTYTESVFPMVSAGMGCGEHPDFPAYLASLAFDSVPEKGGTE